jgi:hypothetical protein
VCESALASELTAVYIRARQKEHSDFPFSICNFSFVIEIHRPSRINKRSATA